MPRSFDILVAGEIDPDLILSGNVIPEFGQVEKLVDSAQGAARSLHEPRVGQQRNRRGRKH